MLVTDRFVYLHLHKSGGTFVNEALMRFAPGARMLGYHLPRSLIPPECRHLPVLGFVRNPWSYYVSWYSFQTGLSRPNHLFRCVSEDGLLGFGETIRRLLAAGSDDALFERIAAGLPADYTNTGLNLPRSALAPLRNSGLGFYSFLYRHIYAGSGGSLTVGRTETLRADLVSFWAAIGFTPAAGLLDFASRAPERNRSAHDNYRGYYDPSLRDLVGACDRELIEAFGYEFE